MRLLEAYYKHGFSVVLEDALVFLVFAIVYIVLAMPLRERASSTIFAVLGYGGAVFYGHTVGRYTIDMMVSSSMQIGIEYFVVAALVSPLFGLQMSITYKYISMAIFLFVSGYGFSISYLNHHHPTSNLQQYSPMCNPCIIESVDTQPELIDLVARVLPYGLTPKDYWAEDFH